MTELGITHWFNYMGLVFVVLLLLPNLVYAMKNKDQQPQQQNKIISILEQTARYGVMLLMVFNLPYTVLGFYFHDGQIVYVVFNAVLMAAYWLAWLIFWKRQSLTKTLLLSIIPSVIFLFSGVIIVSLPLIAFGVVFAIAHIYISVQNYRREQQHGLQ